MRLTDIPRTTGFRIVLLFVMLFELAALILFGFLYWQTVGYLEDSVDDQLARLQAPLVRLPLSAMRDAIDQLTAESDDLYRIGLVDGTGNHLVGNLPSFSWQKALLDQPFKIVLKIGPKRRLFHAIVRQLPSGERLVVSQNVHEMAEFKDLLVNAMAWGSLLTLAVGLVGGGAMGIGAVRRMDAVTDAIKRIVAGDLSKRLPCRGKFDDIDRLVGVVNRMLDEIEWLMREVKGVCDGVAHDLRTPLTRLLAGLERARRRNVSASQYASAVDEAIDEVRSVLSTFGALLRISEIESGARKAGFTQVDMARIASDVVEFYDPVGDEKGIHLSLDTVTDGLAIMPGDASLLFEAIGNLVDNALKFTAAGGQVTVTVESDVAGPAVTVTDNGPGIASEDRETVLLRFRRSEKAKHVPGSGLGLSLVAAVARLHGLDLKIEDADPGCRIALRRAG